MRSGLRGAAAAASLFAFFTSSAPVASAEQTFAPDAIRQDFAALYDGLQSGSFNFFAFTPKAEMDHAYTAALADLNTPMTKLETEKHFEGFIAKAHLAHARIDFPYADWSAFLDGDGKTFPLQVRIIGERIYVEQNRSGIDGISPGDEILSINGEPARQWLNTLTRQISAETPYMARAILEPNFRARLWYERDEIETFSLTLRARDGGTATVSVPARTASEMQEFAAKQPPLLSIWEPMRDVRILAGNVGYLRPGPFYNAEAKTGADEWDVSGFRAFIDDAFAKFRAAGVDRLITDLRGNPGGDNLFSDVMVAWFADRPFRFFSKFQVKVSPESTKANADRIAHDAAAAGPVSQQYAHMYSGAKNGDVLDFEMPMADPRAGERFMGKVFALIDRRSYSNTVALAAMIQDDRLGTLLGEETSDPTPQYGAMEQFTLPNTGIVVGYPKAYIVRPAGPGRAGGVKPDITIAIPVVQTSADPVLQRALSIALSAH
ncbi:MAG: hypothetical protein GC166_06740 [Alphaproteobacteria bacterium]|nr:hypothetical protein [Alphaproteobacteria bacterium]